MQHAWGKKEMYRDETLHPYKDLHVRVTDESDKGKVCRIRLSVIVLSESRPTKRSKGDISPNNIQWEMFTAYLRDSNNITHESNTKRVVFVHPYAGNRVVKISN